MWEERFGNLDAESVKELHEILRPYFLRRIKKDVMGDVFPAKV